MIKEEDLLKIGKFTKPHGIKGEISLLSNYDFSCITGEPYVVCEMDGIWVPFFIDSYRQKSDAIILVKFENIDSGEKVKMLSAKAAYLPAEMIQSPYDHSDSADYIIGYSVVSGNPEFLEERTRSGSEALTKSGQSNSEILGQVQDVDDSTDNILLKVEYNGNEILIPLALVKDIDHELKTVTVSLPEGFLEIWK